MSTANFEFSKGSDASDMPLCRSPHYRCRRVLECIADHCEGKGKGKKTDEGQTETGALMSQACVERSC